MPGFEVVALARR